MASDEKEKISSKLQELGYVFRPEFSTANRLFLKREDVPFEEGLQTYHIHLMSSKSEEWKDLLFFRDYLRDHPDASEQYADLKKKASLEAHEIGDVYRKIKKPFIEGEILRKRSRFS